MSAEPKPEKEPESEPEKKGILDRVSAANIVAFVSVLTVLFASIYYQKWETVAIIGGAALTYLFPKQK